MSNESPTSLATPLGSGLKRKASTAFVPDSLLSYLAGSLDTDFGDLQLNMDRNTAFEGDIRQSPSFVKQLVEELFRYLYLLAADNTSVPSHRIELAHRQLLLDPVLYFQVCDKLLKMHGRDNIIRVLPHDPLDDINANQAHKKARFVNTLVRYQRIFDQDSPDLIWRYEPNAPSLVVVTDGETDVPKDSYEVKLKLTNHQGDEPVEFVVWKGCQFAIIVDQLRHRYNISAGKVRMSQSDLLIKPHMTPGNLNLRDGHEISCSFPFLALPVEITFRHVDWKDEDRDVVVRAESLDVTFGEVQKLFAQRVGDVFNQASSYEFKYNGSVCYDCAATLRSMGIVDTGVIMCRTKHHTGPERTIVINFRDICRFTTYFTVMAHTRLREVIKNYAERYSWRESDVRIMFDCEPVQYEATVGTLELDDGDSFDVYLRSDY